MAYEDILSEAEKAAHIRSKQLDKRGNIKDIRKYHMTEEEIKEYYTKKHTLGIDVLNPLKRDGAYKAQVETLIILGVNIWHPHIKVLKKLEEVMSSMRPPNSKQNIWEKFSNKRPRFGSSVPKDIDGRILQNFEILQRFTGNNPYGYKLKQVFMTVDIKLVPTGKDANNFDEFYSGQGRYFYRLNTLHSSNENITSYNNYKKGRK